MISLFLDLEKDFLTNGPCRWGEYLPSQERNICRFRGMVLRGVFGVGCNALGVGQKKPVHKENLYAWKLMFSWNPFELHNIPGKCLGITFFRISKFRSQLIEEQFFASLEPCWEI